MNTTLYHGAGDRHSILKVGSWLTQIPTHAIAQAKKRAGATTGAGYVHIVAVGDEDVRKPTDADRTEENRNNDFDDEGWVWITKNELPVAEFLTTKEAERRFCGAGNLLGPT
jgi:hypothetical protein